MATATKSTATKKASSARRNTAKAKAKPKSKPKRKPTLKTRLAKLSGKLALQGTAAVGRRALDSLADAGRNAVETVRERTGAPHLPNVRRLPIQRSIDIAVPLEVAWDEWMALEFLPEGTHRVEEIERDGDGRLVGPLAGVLGGDWEAEVRDQREDESFAWRSTEG